MVLTDRALCLPTFCHALWTVNIPFSSSSSSVMRYGQSIHPSHHHHLPHSSHLLSAVNKTVLLTADLLLLLLLLLLIIIIIIIIFLIARGFDG